jgi:hypothetical protein
MKELIITTLPWLISVITIYMMIAVGNKNRTGWVIGMICQVLWGVWSVTTESWGFVPLNIFMWVICIRNFYKWKK